MEGKIAYRFETPAYPGNILYINLIKGYSCTNDCRFCRRPRRQEDIGKENIYERKARAFLYLAESPSVEQVIEEIDSGIKTDDQEVAIIGLGEPLIYFQKVTEVVRITKERYKVKTRVDTNGLAKCLHANPARRLKEAGLDEIRISVNATSEEEYQILCRPRYEDAFEKLCEFTHECISEGIDTKASFVIGFEDEETRSRTPEEYEKFAAKLGVEPRNIILRQYVKPTD